MRLPIHVRIDPEGGDSFESHKLVDESYARLALLLYDEDVPGRFAAVRFERVVAYRAELTLRVEEWLAGPRYTVFHDPQSRWKAELLERPSDNLQALSDSRHFLVSAHPLGLFEVLAADCVVDRSGMEPETED